MTGNELIDKLSSRFGTYKEGAGLTSGNYITTRDWQELRRLALLGYAGETAPVMAWHYFAECSGGTVVDSIERTKRARAGSVNEWPLVYRQTLPESKT